MGCSSEIREVRRNRRKMEKAIKYQLNGSDRIYDDYKIYKNKSLKKMNQFDNLFVEPRI